MKPGSILSLRSLVKCYCNQAHLSSFENWPNVIEPGGPTVSPLKSCHRSLNPGLTVPLLLAYKVIHNLGLTVPLYDRDTQIGCVNVLGCLDGQLGRRASKTVINVRFDSSNSDRIHFHEENSPQYYYHSGLNATIIDWSLDSWYHLSPSVTHANPCTFRYVVAAFQFYSFQEHWIYLLCTMMVHWWVSGSDVSPRIQERSNVIQRHTWFTQQNDQAFWRTVKKRTLTRSPKMSYLNTVDDIRIWWQSTGFRTAVYHIAQQPLPPAFWSICQVFCQDCYNNPVLSELTIYPAQYNELLELCSNEKIRSWWCITTFTTQLVILAKLLIGYLELLWMKEANIVSSFRSRIWPSK